VVQRKFKEAMETEINAAISYTLAGALAVRIGLIFLYNFIKNIIIQYCKFMLLATTCPIYNVEVEFLNNTVTCTICNVFN
ncbi:hypothetical protein ILUMI_09131, partial [Ignelater luminosus]